MHKVLIIRTLDPKHSRSSSQQPVLRIWMALFGEIVHGITLTLNLAPLGNWSDILRRCHFSFDTRQTDSTCRLAKGDLSHSYRGEITKTRMERSCLRAQAQTNGS